jgi:diguanylate cyclase (GGDEF)-like protein
MQGADILHFPQTAGAAPFMLDTGNVADMTRVDLQWSNRLHESLDVGDVLETFLGMLRQEYRISGLSYELPDAREQITFGRVGKDGAEFRLRHRGENLGRLVIGNVSTPDRRLGALLGLIGAPLYNALCHHRLKQMARRDPLTGLGNRLALDHALATEVARAQRFGAPFTLLVIDIDHFKKINDTLGHAAGDQVIRRLAEEIRHSLRPYDQGFRFGGEEFIVILSQTTLAKGLQIAERIREAAQAKRLCEASGEAVTVSIGAAEYRCEEEDQQQLFERADAALYKAKREGRNQVRTA